MRISSARSRRIRSNRSSSRGDPLEDQRLGLGRHPAQARRLPVSAALSQVVDRLDAELRVDLPDGLGSEPGDAQQLDQARRDLRAEAVVVGHVAGRRQLLDLVADRLADARDLGRLPGPVGRHEVDRAASDGVGRAVIGDRLEDELALELEDVADLVEDPREVAVGQLGRLIRRGLGSCADGSRSGGDGTRSGGDDPVAAGALGPVERLVGLGDQLVDRLVGTAGDRDPDRDADRVDAEALEVERPDGDAHALADVERDVGRRVAQQDDELLAAVAGRHVVLADGRDDRAADRAQDLVAGRVTVRVVEDLELVDVDHQHADRVIGAPTAREQAAELVEVAPVRQAGQGVGRCLRLGRPLGIGARQRRRCLARPPVEQPAGRRRPGARCPVRQDDRADDAALGGQRRGQRVGQAVDPSSPARRSGRRSAGGSPGTRPVCAPAAPSRLQPGRRAIRSRSVP